MKISKNRFEQLVALEARVDNLIERIYREKSMRITDILYAIGTYNSVYYANRMVDEEEEDAEM